MSALAEHLQKDFRQDLLNDPNQWGNASIVHPPSFDVLKYQSRINKIVGTADGKPIIKLVWAWHSRIWVNNQWDSFGIATRGDWRARYRFLTVKFGNDSVDLSPPRWILEERFEPGQYWDSWEGSRWVHDPILQMKVDLRGPAPREGWYGYLELIATHDANKACCERQWQTRRSRCWGYYKEPGESELNQLRRAVFNRNKDPEKHSVHEPLPQSVLEEIQRDVFTEQEQLKAEQKEEIHERISNELDVWGWRLTETDPTRLSQGKWHDLATNYKKKESGLYVPETV